MKRDDKKMEILERHKIIRPDIPNIKRLWAEEIAKHKHVLSVSSSMAKACGWEAKKVKDYCLSLGFNGAEIRFQNSGNSVEVLETLAKDENFLLTAHLSDFAHWLYSPKQIQDLMTPSIFIDN